MSAVSTSRAKKVDPLSKKTPANPKYEHVKPVVDTDFRIKKGEIFKRMKITTFVQLIIQVGEYDNPQSHFGNGDITERPDTADEEVKKIQQGDNQFFYEEGNLDSARSTLQRNLRLVVLYDEDERITPYAANILTERGYDNLFMLSGGRLSKASSRTGSVTSTVSSKASTYRGEQHAGKVTHPRAFKP
ncbi:hypothetical protein KUTeg_020358 [Tegillarca granosa]|uniref:Rhodanese domain-containing protein n=1 Tax=Tegillarca granosa TaxID=220873 RepID=A0ABQ9E7L9_TEGGR|nr:hypothetical protein KUTeg_020358 [Tegillarca granosa]